MDRLDYAPHYLAAKKKLLDTYNMLNKNEHAEAVPVIDEIIAELRLMRSAVKTHVKDING